MNTINPDVLSFTIALDMFECDVTSDEQPFLFEDVLQENLALSDKNLLSWDPIEGDHPDVVFSEMDIPTTSPVFNANGFSAPEVNPTDFVTAESSRESFAPAAVYDAQVLPLAPFAQPKTVVNTHAVNTEMPAAPLPVVASESFLVEDASYRLQPTTLHIADRSLAGDKQVIVDSPTLTVAAPVAGTLPEQGVDPVSVSVQAQTSVSFEGMTTPEKLSQPDYLIPSTQSDTPVSKVSAQVVSAPSVSVPNAPMPDVSVPSAPLSVSEPNAPVLSVSEPSAFVPNVSGPTIEMTEKASMTGNALPTPAEGAVIRMPLRTMQQSQPDVMGQQTSPTPQPLTLEDLPPLPTKSVSFQKVAETLPVDEGINLQTVSEMPEGELKSIPLAEFTRSPIQNMTLSTTTPFMKTTVDVPVYTPEFEEAFSEKIMWMTSQNIKGAQIQLNPAELGPVTAQIQVEAGKTHIQFMSDHALVRDTLEAALPRLKSEFEQLNMQLGDVDVGAHESHAGLDQFAREARQGQFLNTSADVGQENAATATLLKRSSHQGLVDTYA